MSVHGATHRGSSDDDAGLVGALRHREGRHPEATTEWWYFTGHLVDEQQHRYGFDLQAFVLTDVDDSVGRHQFTRAYEVDAAISDLSTGQFHSSIRRLLPCPWFRMAEQTLDIRLGATRLTAIEPSTYRLRTRWCEQSIDLEARAMREPVAHGGGSGVKMGGAGWSHYWSGPRLEATGVWTSPATGITYPCGWRVRVPLLDAQFVVTPELAHQELVSETSGYWEGVCSVTGSVAGTDADGVAYVELAGYSSTMV